MDQGKSLEENLKGHTIVEFPLFAVIKKEMLSHFKIISIGKVSFTKHNMTIENRN
jgi:hypothetical protein